METSEYFREIRNRWRFILAATLVGLAIATVFALLKTPLYEASSTVFVSTPTSGTTAELQQGSTFTQNRITTYTNLVRTPIVMQPVLDELDLPDTKEELAARVTAANPVGTNLITIRASDADPVVAANIANSLAESLTRGVEQVETPAGGTTSPVRLTSVAGADVPPVPSSPNFVLYLAIGALVGLIAGTAAAVLRKALDTKVRKPKDLSALSSRPLIGSIPADGSLRDRPLAIHSDPSGNLSEAFRSLRTNLQYVEINGAKSFVVTSSIPGEGKSTTTVNLAIALADAGQRVALIEADLRRPKVADYLGVEGGAGLSDVLIGRAEIADVMLPWGNGRLFVLPAGKIPPNPSELLGSRQMRQLVELVEREFDIVLFDAPPLLPVTDAVVVSQLAAGTIMVVASGKTNKHQVEHALRALDNVGSTVVGLVLTMTPQKGPDADVYGYGYGYAPASPSAPSASAKRKARPSRKRRREDPR